MDIQKFLESLSKDDFRKLQAKIIPESVKSERKYKYHQVFIDVINECKTCGEVTKSKQEIDVLAKGEPSDEHIHTSSIICDKCYEHFMFMPKCAAIEALLNIIRRIHKLNVPSPLPQIKISIKDNLIDDMECIKHACLGEDISVISDYFPEHHEHHEHHEHIEKQDDEME